MSDVRELPHEVLLRRYGLSVSQLSNHTQQLKKDLDKTITFIINKSKNGKINLTPAVESKIDTYDRYICDGIFEHLESKDVITEAQATQLKDKADDAREDVIDDLKDDADDSTQSNDNSNNPSPASTEAKIGFWDWN
jgi:hypothetical protein